jgi:glycerol-3-phosphate dehydrogenase (NAD(P)+)
MKIGVIGAGSWGTALANVVAANGHDTTLWAYEPELVAGMTATRVNHLFLPDIELHSALHYTGELSEVAKGADLLLLVTPTQVMRGVLTGLETEIGAETLLASASKGIELGTLCTVSQICGQVLGERSLSRFVALSGPTFAKEVALGLPSLIVAGSVSATAACQVQDVFSNSVFRVYTSSDAIGVELGGALKNVIAIAAGIGDGLGFGHNTRAALITRGLAEMRRLGRALGAQDATFAGLAGMGDLVLTCTGDLSRNRTVGIKLGQGIPLDTIMAEMRMVAEGVKSAASVNALALRLGVDMPITQKVYEILYGHKPARQAVLDLMSRDLKSEHA